MSLSHHELTEIYRLVELWESLALSSRQMADEHDNNYAKGYGYGVADGHENAAKNLRALIASLQKEK